MLSKLQQLKGKKCSIVTSPAYELRKEALWAKMKGEDLIVEIKKSLMQQLHSKVDA